MVHQKTPGYTLVPERKLTQTAQYFFSRKKDHKHTMIQILDVQHLN